MNLIIDFIYLQKNKPTITMTKMKYGLVAVVMLMSNFVIAQSVQEAKKFMYYGRYQSAKVALEKVVAGNQWSSFGFIVAEAELARMK